MTIREYIAKYGTRSTSLIVGRAVIEAQGAGRITPELAKSIAGMMEELEQALQNEAMRGK